MGAHGACPTWLQKGRKCSYIVGKGVAQPKKKQKKYRLEKENKRKKSVLVRGTMGFVSESQGASQNSPPSSMWEVNEELSVVRWRAKPQRPEPWSALPNLCPTAIYGEPPPQAQWIQECSPFRLIKRRKGWGVPACRVVHGNLAVNCCYECVSMCNQDENIEPVQIDNCPRWHITLPNLNNSYKFCLHVAWK